MEMMRHSDLRLTMKIHTDGSQLPTSEALDLLPRFGEVPQLQMMVATGTDGMATKKRSQMRSHIGVAGGQSLSQSVAVMDFSKDEQGAEKPGNCSVLSQSVATSYAAPECEVKRVTEGTRTPDPRDHNPML